MSNGRLKLETLAEIDVRLEALYEDFEKLGQQFHDVFDADRQKMISAQVRNLQQVVVSATRFGDIEDFVKNQMGKTTQSAQAWQRVGNAVLAQLETLAGVARELCPDAPGQQLQARLRLARSWV